MENNTGYALGIGFPGQNKEVNQAREMRTAEKKELQQSVERVAGKLIAILEADVDKGQNSLLYNYKVTAEALHNITSAVAQMESYAETPLDMLSGMTGLLPKLEERHD